MTPTPHVEFSLRARVGEIVLNRPEELHALSLPMIDAMNRQLAEWAEDPKVVGVTIRSKGKLSFCAGIDQRALYRALRSGDRDYGRVFFQRFYQLLYRIARYPKPTMSVMDGATTGGGVALAMQCQKRVATRNTYFSTAECRVGYFPDGGLGPILGRCPGEQGMYFALAGVALRGRGLVQTGLATHLAPEDQVHMISPLLIDHLEIAPAHSELADLGPTIDQVFGLSSAKTLLGILAVRSGNWAKDTSEAIRKQSPTAIAVTYRHLRSSKDMSLEETLKQDFRLSQNLLDGHDFLEGIRAFVIERDEKPVWQPGDIASVSEGELDQLFGPILGVPDWTPAG
ncbi:MAG TPA: enoyl-CoA hydratase/isomerase family protein [Dongiaceae bacterium]